MQGRSYSNSNHAAFRLALIAFTCVLMVFLSGSSLARLVSTDWLERQIDECVDQIEAPNHTSLPVVPLAISFADDLHEEVVELSEPTEEDETEHYLLAVRRFDVAPSGSQTRLYQSSADVVLTSFLLRVFSSRGSPSA